MAIKHLSLKLIDHVLAKAENDWLHKTFMAASNVNIDC